MGTTGSSLCLPWLLFIEAAPVRYPLMPMVPCLAGHGLTEATEEQAFIGCLFELS